MKLLGIALFIFAQIGFYLMIVPLVVQKRIQRFQSDLVSKYYEEIENMYRTMRMWKHNYHNHLQVMQAYIRMQQMKELESYLEDMQGEMVTMETVLKTGNVQADAILNSKIALMKHYGIPVDVTAIVPNDVGMTGTELSVLLGNLLDNALEACLKIDDPNKRFIRIYIDILKDQLYICVTNAMVGKAHSQNGVFASTKNSRHGFGLLSIDHIVKKNKGYLNRKSEQDVFATEVMLPIK